jgi:hypothetical protein
MSLYGSVGLFVTCLDSKTIFQESDCLISVDAKENEMFLKEAHKTQVGKRVLPLPKEVNNCTHKEISPNGICKKCGKHVYYTF